jgi:hypothetical protein
MDKRYEIIGMNEHAIFKSDFSVALSVLQDSATWGSQALRVSGASWWKVKILSMFNRYFFPSKIEPISINTFLALSFYLQHLNFAYSITRGEIDKTIIITPKNFIPPSRKIRITLFSAYYFILPAFLSPLIWNWAENYTYHFSKKHLEHFCLMLQENLISCDNRIIHKDD